MRSVIPAIVAIGALVTAAPGAAQTYDPRFPVCMHVYGGDMGGGRLDRLFLCVDASMPGLGLAARGHLPDQSLPRFCSDAATPLPTRRTVEFR